ncbi:MAG: PIG-L deacetylase family protein, partial [Terriglobales bacterium]
MPDILCITAHPDDEAANFGGTVAHYAAQGVGCHLVCLTAGEAARNRGGAADNAALQAMRRGELAASCRILGFATHQVWDLPDAHLPQALFYPAVGRIVAVIRRLRPVLVLCMGPEGSATAHPDHAMSGVLATAAFHWAAHERFFPEQQLPPVRPQRLFYSSAPAQPPGFPLVWLPIPDIAIPVDEFLERKIAAFRAHTS